MVESSRSFRLRFIVAVVGQTSFNQDMNTNFTIADDATFVFLIMFRISLKKKGSGLHVCNATTQNLSLALPFPIYYSPPCFAVCTFNRVYVMYFVIAISSAQLCRNQHLSEVVQGNTLGSG